MSGCIGWFLYHRVIIQDQTAALIVNTESQILISAISVEIQSYYVGFNGITRDFNGIIAITVWSQFGVLLKDLVKTMQFCLSFVQTLGLCPPEGLIVQCFLLSVTEMYFGFLRQKSAVGADILF